jgi:hypothetical protein
VSGRDETLGARAGAERTGPRPVDVRTRFERFPATLKGAFVLRGDDGDPHVVVLEGASLARLPSGRAVPVPTEPLRVDVAPARDLFVPFEAPVSELSSGWYEIRSTIRVDGGRTYEFGSRPFCVGWPRGEIRRGTHRVGRSVSLASLRFEVDRVELANDFATVVWRSESDVPARAALLADGSELESLPNGVGRPSGSSGERRSMTYPVPRAASKLTVAIELPSGQRTREIGVPLG